MKSVWTDSVQNRAFNTLQGDTSTDVLIIGGGMAGLLSAYLLQEKGVNYMLVEAKKIGHGVTQNTTAKITVQHGLIYDKLIRSVGVSKAKQYLSANMWALEKYRSLCSKIDCNFEEKSAYTYSLSSGGKYKVQNEVKALEKLGIKTKFVDKLEIALPITGAVELPNQAQFNPIKFIQHISKGLNIYEDTFVKKLHGNVAITAQGKITAKKIIVATHFPFINTHGLYPLKLYQHRSYVIALENAPQINGMYVDEAQNGMSFRNYNNLLLVGGGDHRTGHEGGNWDVLRKFASKHFKDATEKYAWATQDCMSLDSIPYIGHYSSNTPDLLVATGFNKWGMTSSMVSAKILLDMAIGLNVTSPYSSLSESVFSPQRTMLKKQLAVNLGETSKNFFSFNTRRCPHLGCGLIWNSQEHSWDCACHGSRFEMNGKLIDNPAKRNADV